MFLFLRIVLEVIVLVQGLVYLVLGSSRIGTVVGRLCLLLAYLLAFLLGHWPWCFAFLSSRRFRNYNLQDLVPIKLAYKCAS